MATWHQQRNAAGLQALYQPHPTQWKCVSDHYNQFASAMLFSAQAEAERYAAKNGELVIPPRGAPYEPAC